MATPIPPNRCAFTSDEIRRATSSSGTLTDGLFTTSVSIDSRAIAPGALFIALRGLRDGHEFLAAAARAGASAAIVERGRALPAFPCFEVADTLAALGALAAAHLQRMRAATRLPTIAIGGAAGKTTTKELTAAAMRAVHGATLATPGNLNNLIGVPMTIFTLDATHRAAVLECGTNQRGEIARLAAIVQPDAALVLNVDIEHTEGLGSLAGVADEEAAIFATARRAVVSSAESMLLERIPAGIPRLTFGLDETADIRLIERAVAGTGQQIIELALHQELVEDGHLGRIRFPLNLLGATSALNAAGALAASVAAIDRLLSGGELQEIGAALGKVLPVSGRLMLRDRGGIIVIDDTYNSNPRSFRAALAAARETAEGLQTRLIVAIGDMLELGDLSAEMHLAALNDVFNTLPAACVLVGPEMRCAAITHRVPSWVALADDSLEAARKVHALARPGDVLLVKGSRGIAMERIIDALPEPRES